MLGSIIKRCGDTLDESHMPLGWTMLIDGTVRQFCMHKKATIQELGSMLEEFDLQRSSVEINRNTPQWSHNSVWNRRYIDPKSGYTLQQLWKEAFFGSNTLIALARSLCKCLLAVLITASGADAVTGYLVRCACIDNTIP